MSKKTKILIIGFGSIGQRHYRNLTKLGYREVYVYDIDKKKVNEKKIKSIKTLSVGELKNFEIAFVCNPNNLHISAALKCARAGCHLFIEKPLSHNLKGIDELIALCQKKRLINMVACNMRFHPCLKFIKNYLAKKKLGKIYGIRHEYGQYLPYWRPWQDYRKNYAAKKSTGGGIILDDIHEFDLLFWLNDFHQVVQSKLIFDKVSDLKIETEDSCLASFKFKNKVLGSVACDYLQQAYSRGCKVVGEKGNLEWDENQNLVWLKTKTKPRKLFELKNYDFNKMYIEEIKYYLNSVAKKQKTFNDLKTAKLLLSHCLER